MLTQSPSELFGVIELLHGGHVELDHILRYLLNLILIIFCLLLIFALINSDHLIGHHIEVAFQKLAILVCHQQYFLLLEVTIHRHPHGLA